MELQSQTLSLPHRTHRREPVVFGHALELLLTDTEALGSRALNALAGLGLSPREPFRAAYPGALWAGAIHILSGALYPHLSAPRAELALGQRFMERALQSRMGAAMTAHARAVGPERTLQRLPHTLRTFNNFLGASVRELRGHAGWELVIRPLPEFFLATGVYAEPPAFTRGVLTTAFHAAGVSRVQMDVMHHDASLGMSIFHLAF